MPTRQERFIRAVSGRRSSSSGWEVFPVGLVGHCQSCCWITSIKVCAKCLTTANIPLPAAWPINVLAFVTLLKKQSSRCLAPVRSGNGETLIWLWCLLTWQVSPKEKPILFTRRFTRSRIADRSANATLYAFFYFFFFKVWFCLRRLTSLSSSAGEMAVMM